MTKLFLFKYLQSPSTCLFSLSFRHITLQLTVTKERT